MPLKSVDLITHLELDVIKQIIHDETWLEAERRGQPVDKEDPIVIAAVCDIVMRIGAQMRTSLNQAHPEFVHDQDHVELLAA
jgi:hypothetical protein